MKTLYIECAMGVAGDMLTAALYELLPDKQAFLDTMNALGMHGIHIEAVPASAHGIVGTHMSVCIHGQEETTEDSHHHHHHDCGSEHPHHHEHSMHHHGDEAHHHAHHHYSLGDVQAIIQSMALPDAVKVQAQSVYDAIAAAESRAHGQNVDMIHFHEVGALDAIADVVGACYALYLLAPDHVVVSPVRTGYGQVRCAHGIMPVPAPATAFLLEGIPCYAGDIEGEMCTPTGAALLRTFADAFEQRPLMTVSAVGYGMGTKDFGAANCVRAYLGETDDSLSDSVAELVCNIDDMTAEALAYAMEQILAAGALDVSAVPAIMKKGRPGHILHVLAPENKAQAMARVMLRETASNGVRFHSCRRMKLSYSFETVETPYGPVRIKRAEGWDTGRAKPEYEDVAALARKNDLPFSVVWQAAVKSL